GRTNLLLPTSQRSRINSDSAGAESSCTGRSSRSTERGRCGSKRWRTQRTPICVAKVRDFHRFSSGSVWRRRLNRELRKARKGTTERRKPRLPRETRMDAETARTDADTAENPELPPPDQEAFVDFEKAAQDAAKWRPERRF